MKELRDYCYGYWDGHTLKIDLSGMLVRVHQFPNKAALKDRLGPCLKEALERSPLMVKLRRLSYMMPGSCIGNSERLVVDSLAKTPEDLARDIIKVFEDTFDAMGGDMLHLYGGQHEIDQMDAALSVIRPPRPAVLFDSDEEIEFYDGPLAPRQTDMGEAIEPYHVQQEKKLARRKRNAAIQKFLKELEKGLFDFYSTPNEEIGRNIYNAFLVYGFFREFTAQLWDFYSLLSENDHDEICEKARQIIENAREIPEVIAKAVSETNKEIETLQTKGEYAKAGMLRGQQLFLVVTALMGVQAVKPIVKAGVKAAPTVAGKAKEIVKSVPTLPGRIKEGVRIKLMPYFGEFKIGVKIKDLAPEHTEFILKAAQRPARGRGRTSVGRHGQKHGDRVGTVYPKLTGSPEKVNAAALEILETIIRHPDAYIQKYNWRFKGPDIFIPGGIGARFDYNLVLQGFLEPLRKKPKRSRK